MIDWTKLNSRERVSRSLSLMQKHCIYQALLLYRDALEDQHQAMLIAKATSADTRIIVGMLAVIDGERKVTAELIDDFDMEG